MVDVSVVIVNWNTCAVLRDCLRSIYEQTNKVEFEVIVVDNGSADGSPNMVSNDFPEVTLIENTSNRGFAAASNQGMAVARGRYVLLLNSDTIILNEALSKTIGFADAHPEAAVVGCRTLNYDGSLQPTCFMFPSLLNMCLSTAYLYKLFARSRFFGRERMSWWDRSDAREVDVVTGCFMLVRREAIDQVGMMDERFFVYEEETDWCYRFRKSGWKILFTPEPEIIHYGRQTVKQMECKLMFQLYGSKLIFMRLHKKKLQFILSRFLIALFFSLRVPYWLLVGILHKKEREKAMQTAQSYLIGLFYCLVDWKRLLISKEAVK